MILEEYEKDALSVTIAIKQKLNSLVAWINTQMLSKIQRMPMYIHNNLPTWYSTVALKKYYKDLKETSEEKHSQEAEQSTKLDSNMTKILGI